MSIEEQVTVAHLSNTPFARDMSNATEANQENPQLIKKRAQKLLQSVKKDHFKTAVISMDEIIEMLSSLIAQRSANRETPFQFLNGEPLDICISSISKSTFHAIPKMPVKRADTFLAKLIDFVAELTEQTAEENDLSAFTITGVFTEFDTLAANFRQSAVKLQKLNEMSSEQLVATISEISETLKPLTDNFKNNIDNLEESNRSSNDLTALIDVTDIIVSLIAIVGNLPPKRCSSLVDRLFTVIGNWVKQIGAKNQQSTASIEIVNVLQVLTDCLKSISNALRQHNESDNKQYNSAVSNSFYSLKLLIIRLNNYMYSLKQSSRSINEQPVTGISDILNSIAETTANLKPDRAKTYMPKLIEITGDIGLQFASSNENEDLDIINIFSAMADTIGKLPSATCSALMPDLEMAMEKLISTSINKELQSENNVQRMSDFSAIVIGKLQAATHNLSYEFIDLLRLDQQPIETEAVSIHSTVPAGSAAHIRSSMTHTTTSRI